jgi:predicted RNA-binding protein YlxR (DUF448 family)
LNKALIKKKPQRTCVGCHQVQDKKELLRLVLTAYNKVEIDPNGKKAGRGTYICRNQDCWQKGLNVRNLERALKIKINQQNIEELAKEGRLYLGQE